MVKNDLLLMFFCLFMHHFPTSLVVFVYGRRMLMFPKGNNVDHLSMYLDVADSRSLPYGWSRYAQFSLSVVNQIHNRSTIKKGLS